MNTYYVCSPPLCWLLWNAVTECNIMPTLAAFPMHYYPAAQCIQSCPVYPESATRRLLWNAWLPDAFLNPHGYPTPECVQPFSEYSSWITTPPGAETGRTNWVPPGWFTSLGCLA